MLRRDKVAANFLADYLPPDLAGVIDLEGLEVLKDSFVDSDLQEFFSDLLYRVRLQGSHEAFVYILLEHKSAPDRWVAFQLLRYMVKIWEPIAKKSGARGLPPIIPIVFYQGRPRWNIARDFRSLVEIDKAEALGKCVPDFEYQLCDLVEYDIEKQGDSLILRVGMAALKSHLGIDQPEGLRKFLELGEPLQSGSRDELEFLLTALIYYSLAAEGLSKTDFAEAVGDYLPRQKERIMSTVAEEWKAELMPQLRAEARAELEAELRQEGQAELTLILLGKRLGKVSAAARKKILRLPAEKLQELGLALFDFHTPKDLSGWLAKHGRAS